MLTKVKTGIGVGVSLLLSLVLVKVAGRFGGQAKGPRMLDGRVGVAVLADGVVVRNLTGKPIRDVTVQINDYTSDTVHMDVLDAVGEAQVTVSSSLTITQVVVSIGPLDQIKWTAEVNGRDPRSVAQRKKTMAEVLGKK